MYANCNTKKVSVKARKIPSNKEKEGDHIDITYYPRYDTILRENIPCFSNTEYYKKNPSDTCYDCILKQPDIEIECPKCGNKNGDGIILVDNGVISRMDENDIPICRAKSYIR